MFSFVKNNFQKNIKNPQARKKFRPVDYKKTLYGQSVLSIVFLYCRKERIDIFPAAGRRNVAAG